ncbi:hypothetical protein CNR37_00042 [Pseudomonas phage ventosus]|uniref:Uncharacterized protein n=1 Tax=Pseudomonas phage ventosus TaxID=2048980 RepID=A0A2H4P7V5_9CAUD|nr:hypothetical protein CNR37_00042 [Pseudomonas phage ventosus]
MVSPRTEILEDMIPKLQGIKEVMEKELHYDWSVTDELQNIIDALEHDLGEQEERDSE